MSGHGQSTSRVVRANGIDVACDVAADDDDAPWLVCLHSLATDRRIWDAMLAQLETPACVVCPDLRGHGETGATAPPYTLDLLVEDVVDVMDALEIASATIVGLSIGGMIALGAAIHHPERVTALVVADARADAPAPSVERWDAMIDVAERDGVPAAIDLALERWFTAGFAERDGATVEELRRRASATPVEGFVGAARALQGAAYLPALPTLEVPTLFVVGAEDAATTPAVMGEMAAAVAHSRLAVIPHAAHLTPVEAPTAFAALLDGFLAGIGGPVAA